MATPVPDELVRVQRLYLRLLYSVDTVRAFAEDPIAVLALWGIDARWQGLLPNPATAGHAAEMYGRRVLAAQDLSIMFDATLRRLCGGDDSAEAVISSPWFFAFLDSEAFFDPSRSLPHPNGIGRAYEGHSRFFFWARDALGLRAPSADTAVRDDLYLDFAAGLDAQMVRATDPSWERLKYGFFWVQAPGTTGPCRGLTSHREVFTVADTASALAARGLLDLDGLDP